VTNVVILDAVQMADLYGLGALIVCCLGLATGVLLFIGGNLSRLMVGLVMAGAACAVAETLTVSGTQYGWDGTYEEFGTYSGSTAYRRTDQSAYLYHWAPGADYWIFYSAMVSQVGGDAVRSEYAEVSGTPCAVSSWIQHGGNISVAASVTGCGSTGGGTNAPDLGGYSNYLACITGQINVLIAYGISVSNYMAAQHALLSSWSNAIAEGIPSLTGQVGWATGMPGESSTALAQWMRHATYALWDFESTGTARTTISVLKEMNDRQREMQIEDQGFYETAEEYFADSGEWMDQDYTESLERNNLLSAILNELDMGLNVTVGGSGAGGSVVVSWDGAMEVNVMGLEGLLEELQEFHADMNTTLVSMIPSLVAIEGSSQSTAEDTESLLGAFVEYKGAWDSQDQAVRRHQGIIETNWALLLDAMFGITNGVNSDTNDYGWGETNDPVTFEDDIVSNLQDAAAAYGLQRSALTNSIKSEDSLLAALMSEANVLMDYVGAGEGGQSAPMSGGTPGFGWGIGRRETVSLGTYNLLPGYEYGFGVGYVKVTNDLDLSWAPFRDSGAYDVEGNRAAMVWGIRSILTLMVLRLWWQVFGGIHAEDASFGL